MDKEDSCLSSPEGALVHFPTDLHRFIKRGRPHHGRLLWLQLLPNQNQQPCLTHGEHPSPVWGPETQRCGVGRRHQIRVRYQGHRNIQIQNWGWQWHDTQNQNPKQPLCIWIEEVPTVTPTLGAGGERQLSKAKRHKDGSRWWVLLFGMGAS